MTRIISRLASMILATVLIIESGATALADVIYVRASATGANNGTSWADAYTNLQSALGAAQSGDQIWVAAATYSPAPAGGPRTASFEMLSGVGIYGGFAGNETQLEQRNFVTNVTTLSGHTNNSFHVVRATNVDSNGILDGFVVRMGQGSGATGLDKNGAGVLISGGAPRFRNCTIRDNIAWDGVFMGPPGDGGDGGGVHSSNASATFQNCSFISNQAGNGTWNFSGPGRRGGDGGAIFLAGGTVRFESCFFDTNRSGNGANGGDPYPGGRGGDGGAICKHGGAIDLIDCTFTNNTSGVGGHSGKDAPTPARGGTGGAVSVSNALLALDRGQFTGNRSGGRGGAIHTVDSSLASMQYAEFRANSAADATLFGGWGGALYLVSSTVSVADASFLENRAGNGSVLFSSGFGGWGGAIVQESGALTIDRCEFDGNVAGNGAGWGDGGSGGAIAISNATVRNSLFLRNAAGVGSGGSTSTHGQGGAVLVTGASTLINCILADNSTPGTNSSANGGAIRTQAALTIINSTVVANSASASSGGGVSLATTAGVHLNADNCIFWNNADAGGLDESAQIDGFDAGDAVDYSIVQGWTGVFGGVGNSGADPIFADAADDDFGLSPGSPAIDAGNNSAVPAGVVFDINGNPRFVDDPNTPDSGSGTPPIVDMGAAEFGSCLGDTDADQDVDLADLAVLLSSFGISGPRLTGDFDADGDVDLADLVMLLSRFGVACT